MNDKKKENMLAMIRLILAMAITFCTAWLIYKVSDYISQDIENASLAHRFELSTTESPTLPENYYTEISIGATEVEESITSEETSSFISDLVPDTAAAITYQTVVDTYLSQPLKGYDHTGLQNANPDYSAWLDIPYTSISYPVVKSKDNADYLSTTFEGNKKSCGAIFIDANIRNLKSTKNLVIHGHNMKSGSMFGALPSYGNINYYNNHPLIYLYMPDQTIVYQIFSAYSMPHDMNDELAYQDTFANEKEYATFIERLLNRSIIKTDTVTTYEKGILTLSTCINHSSSRFVVHAIPLF